MPVSSFCEKENGKRNKMGMSHFLFERVIMEKIAYEKPEISEVVLTALTS